MDFIAWVVVLFVLALFVVTFYFAVTSSRKEKESKSQMARSLGMTPVSQPEMAIAEKIFALHRLPWGTSKFELRNVSRRPLLDGELFLFDLIDTGGDSETIAENQAVAIRADSLRLPPFKIYPKVDTEKYALGNLANKIIEWGVSKLGTPVNFVEFPAFEASYSVNSTDPEAVQEFFNERMADYFANTEFYTLHADGDMFVFSEIDPGVKVDDQSHMTRRINRALEIYRLFQD